MNGSVIMKGPYTLSAQAQFEDIFAKMVVTPVHCELLKRYGFASPAAFFAENVLQGIHDEMGLPLRFKPSIEPVSPG